MSKNKHVVKGFLLLFAVVFAATIFGGSAYAATTNGIITDSNGIRWEYVYDDSDSSVVTIKFYDKPAALTTVTVPSLSQLRSLVPGAGSIQTYILKDADTSAQDQNYPDLTRREATASTTKLDMSNTSTIQILGVKPIIDPEVETELVFGENMVIGDELAKRVTAQVCKNGVLAWSSWSSGYYYCSNSYENREFTGFESNIPGWDDMSFEEKNDYVPTPADIGCELAKNVTLGNYTQGNCYLNDWDATPGSWSTKIETIYNGRAFAGYKLKLTNFGNFNYVGWESFADSTFNTTSMTINQSGLTGGDIFRNTNLKEVTVETMEVGPGLFRDCAQLKTVHFADSVTRIPNDMFAGTGFTSFDFSQTPIKTVGPRAFEGAHLTSVNFEGVNRIEYGAFRDNDIKELYMPKSINYLESDLFYGNQNMKKVTIAYDTLTSGTTLPFFVVADGRWADKSDQKAPLNHVEELIVLAPYAADEEVSATHVSYDDYRWHYNCITQEHLDYDLRENNSVVNRYGSTSSCAAAGNGYAYINYTGYAEGNEYDGNHVYKYEDEYANAASYKNIIAPIYFYNFSALKKITIGDGYEYIGTAAFWDQRNTDFSNGSWNDATYSNQRSISEVNLPESLKVIGNLAFGYLSKVDVTISIPRGIEFIGMAAFTRTYYYKPEVDFPNLKYLGDHAFAGTQVQNVYLHDKTQYIGNGAFWGVLSIHNITIDYDFFNPNIKSPLINGPSNSNNMSYNVLWFNRMFGAPWSGYTTGYGGSCDLTTHKTTKGFRCDTAGGYTGVKFGTVTFTDKVVTSFPSRYGSNDRHSEAYSTLYDTFFGFEFMADKVDISKTGWKVLPSGMFGYYARIGEVVLPENLEVIATHAFASTWIDNEVVIPDSVKIIGDRAFDPMAAKGTGYGTYTDFTTVKISKLPTGLEYIGYEAFYGDDGLTADLNAPNLKFIGTRAFQGTHLRDVYIGDVQSLREGTFADIPTLRNITIDCDFAKAVTTEVDNSFTIPQSLLDMFDGNAEKAKEFVTPTELTNDGSFSISKYNPTTQRYDQIVIVVNGRSYRTFYTIFNKTMNGDGSDSGQMDSGEEFGIVTFTDKNTTELTAADQGMFAGLSFEELNLEATGWKNFGNKNGMFYKTKMGKLSLPHALETIPTASFEYAEIGDSFTIPGTVTNIGGMAFPWTKIEGDVTFANGSAELTLGENTFYQSQIEGKVTLPTNLKVVPYRMFMQSTVGELELPTEGIEDVQSNAFYLSKIGGEFAMPNTIKSIGYASFMRADLDITNTLPEGLLTVDNAAFYDTDFSDELIIPSTVTRIGWSAFSTGDTDVHYDTVTVKPDQLTVANTTSQRIHQMFWNVSIDKLTIDSSKLVAMDQGVEGPLSEYDGGEEFWNMDMREVVLNNLPKITYAAFNKCDKLEIVDMSKNTKIREIDDKAFMNDEKLHIVKFSPNIKDETVVLGINAFTNTGLVTIGRAGTDFNLAAAHFDATAGEVFSKMKVLKSVDVPDTFSYAKVPEKTFYDSPELEEASIDYKITLIDNAAFSNDNKLKRIFIWGDTVVLDENLPGYEAPEGFGADGDEPEETLGPTIPEGTDIYAYSSWHAEPYAGSSARANFDGVFYPLDEVLYLTTNKTHVKVNDDSTDWDKDGLIVYGMRRDGIVLESDNWAEFDGNVYPRSEKDLTFGKMDQAIMDNPEFATVWDTPVPVNELSFQNENFANIDYELVNNEDGVAGLKRINIIYTDAYTGGEPDTDVLPLGDTPEIPVTLDNIVGYLGILAAAGAAGVGLVALSRRALHRR